MIAAPLAPDRKEPTLYDQARTWVLARSSVSAADMRRDLGTVPAVANQWLDDMEAEGLVTAPNDVKRRAVIGAPPSDGRNDADQIASGDVITGAAQTRLRTIIERVERLEEDKAVIMADMKEVYAEAKGEGFDTKILRKVVAIRKKDKAKYDEECALLDLYMSAIGM